MRGRIQERNGLKGGSTSNIGIGGLLLLTLYEKNCTCRREGGFLVNFLENLTLSYLKKSFIFNITNSGLNKSRIHHHF